MSLPLATLCSKRWPDCYIHWQVARKCAQAAPLYYNASYIDQLVISDCHEGMGPRDCAIAATCQMRFDVMPQHDNDNWPNERDIYAEAAWMQGVRGEDYAQLTEDERLPHLIQWFETERHAKAIAVWPGARQGEVENRRVPPYQWWRGLCDRLVTAGYTIYQCGHPNDLKDHPPLGVDVRVLSLIDAIKISLGCDLAIGTDSGSMIALASYHSTPTLSLVNPHWRGHVTNPLAFAPLGARHTNMWAPSNLDHDIEKIVDMVRRLT